MGKGPEAQLQEQVKWLLGVFRRRGLLDFTRIHVMPVIRRWDRCRCGKEHPVLSPNDDMIGFADIEVVVAPNGRVCYLELKAPRGRLSESQILFRDSRARVGAPVFQIKSIDEFLAALRAMGVDVDSVIKVSSAGNSLLNARPPGRRVDHS